MAANDESNRDVVETIRRNRLKGSPEMRIEALNRSIRLYTPGDTTEAIISRAKAFEEFLTRDVES